MTTFLHGVETIRKTVGTRQIDAVKTAVILLVGSAPTHHVAPADRAPLNQLVLVTGEADHAKFGPDLPAYSIPAALKAHALLGKGLVFVVNVFDPANDKTAVAESTIAITNGKITLPHQDIVDGVVVKAIGTPDVVCAENTDYTIDKVTGVITVVAGGLLDGDPNAKVAYNRANPAGATTTDVIGATSSGGVRSGMQCGLDAQGTFGFAPKIIIAPTFSATKTVADAMGALADKLKAVFYADVPAATSLEDAIAGRAPGETPDLSLVHPRGRYCYPHLKRSDGRLVPMSPYMAAIRAWTDSIYGYWWSPSNKVIPGVSAPELTLSASLTDPACDVNRLNAAGITTVFAAFGKGLKTWGNRTLAFPGGNGIETFESVLVTRDVLEESIEFYALEHVDKPVNQTLIDAVLADIGAFVNKLIGDGALAPGSRVYVDPTLNPPAQLAAGKVRWSYVFCPPPPCELASFESILDTSLLTVTPS